jgi:glutamate 5-kinase
LVANLVDADLLVLVSDTPGLYTADPLVDDGAQLVHEVVSITPQVEAYASGSSSGLGTGGMSTKVSAAKLATSSGTEVRIVDGGEPNVIVRVLRGESIGTRFLAASDRMESRKRWILSGLSHSGKLMVDAGAARAVQKAGASLLPAGIVDVQGAFERGDSVDIVAPDGNTVARGITNYDWNDVRKLLGRQSLEIEDMLGYTYGSYIVHRDDLVRYNRQEQVTHA